MRDAIKDLVARRRMWVDVAQRASNRASLASARAEYAEKIIKNAKQLLEEAEAECAEEYRSVQRFKARADEIQLLIRKLKTQANGLAQVQATRH